MRPDSSACQMSVRLKKWINLYNFSLFLSLSQKNKKKKKRFCAGVPTEKLLEPPLLLGEIETHPILLHCLHYVLLQLLEVHWDYDQIESVCRECCARWNHNCIEL